MRSIQKPKKSKKLFLTIAAAFVIILGGGIYILLAKPFNKSTDPTQQPTRPVNSVDYSPATAQEKQDSENAKKKIVEQQNQSPPQTTLSVTIIRASQSGSSQPLNIRTSIDGATTGTCEATITKGPQQTIRGTGQIAFNATNYTCNIDVPYASFSEYGEWKLSVIAKSGSNTSQPATQNITINK